MIIDTGSLLIIAETAQGYEGKPFQAELLVQAAASAKADAVKLQLIYAEELATPDYLHYGLFKKLEMADEIWDDLCALAHKKGIGFFLDIFGARSLALAERIGADGVKLHSTDMANPGLLSAVATSSIPQILLSGGGCTQTEIDDAITLFQYKPTVLLLGFQGYPTPTDANHIRRLHFLIAKFSQYPKLRFGFADHADPQSTLANLIPAAALGAGASVFEKHLTLAKSLELEDHESALNPDEFVSFVEGMRECEAALGCANMSDEFWGMHESELKYREATHKHIVALRDIAAGAIVSAEDITFKRTQSVNPVHDSRLVLNRRLKTSIRAGTPFSVQDIDGGN
jgi:sialic acid synthase SpsE